MVLVSRPPRKSLLLSVLRSSSPSSASSPSDVVTGVPTLVFLTPYPSRRVESAVPSLSEYVQNAPIRRNLVLIQFAAYPRPSWYSDRRIPCCQASPTACRYRGRLHFVVWFHQDPREHPEGYICRYLQLVRILNTQPVDRDEVDQKPAGGVRGYSPRRKAILDAGFGAYGVDSFMFFNCIGAG